MSDRQYCELSTVKRLLRSAGVRESRVRFSDAYKGLEADGDNTGTIMLSGVSFLDEYSAHETFTFTFTSSTAFSVSGDVLGFIGTGVISSLFTASGKFTVPSANWSGTAVSGDKVYITANSDISNDDGDAFIDDATKLINASLENKFGTLANVTFYSDLTATIPDAISLACVRFAAYEIFNSIFTPTTEVGSPVEKWNDLANRSLEIYVEGHGIGPIWRSRVQKITEIGIAGIDDGVIETDNLTDAENKVYYR